MANNQIGLEAIFENANFQKGISEYNASTNKASSDTKAAGTTMSQVWNGISGVGVAALKGLVIGFTAVSAVVIGTIGVLGKFVLTAAANADQLDELSTKTGISTERLQELGYIGKIVGTDLETVTGANARMIRSMAAAEKGTGSQAAAFKELGVSVLDANGHLRNSNDVFTEVIDSLGKVQNPTEADALAMAIFGKSAQELNPLIKAGAAGLAELAKQAHLTGAVMSDETIKALGDLNDKWDALKSGVTGLGGLFAGMLAPISNRILDTALAGLQSLQETFINFPNDPIGAIADVFYKLGSNLETLFGIQGANDFFSNLGDGFIRFARDISLLISQLNGGVGLFTVFEDGSAVLENFFLAFGLGDEAAHNFAIKVIEIQKIISDAVAFISAHAEEIKGALIAIGAVLAGAGIVSGIAAVGAAIAALATGVGPLLLVAGLLGAAWAGNWGGIRDITINVWKQLEPTFKQLLNWLKINLPKALKVLADYWSRVLLPSIKIVASWIVDNVLPVLVDLVKWLGDNVPKAIQATSDFFENTLLPAIKAIGDWIQNVFIPILTDMRDWFQTRIVGGIQTLIATIQGSLTPTLQALSALWTGVLLPAISAVYNFIQNNIIPIFNAVSNLMTAVVGLAVRVLAGIWQNILLPAIQAVWGFIQNLITSFNNVAVTMSGPLTVAINAIAKVWHDIFLPAIQTVLDVLRPFADFLTNTLKKAFDGILNVIHSVVDWINHLADSINNLSLPDWLTPGSPTPFEIGLTGINEQLKKLASASLPAIRQQMEILGTVRDVPSIANRSAAASVSNSSQSTRNYLFGTQFNIPNATGIVEALQGL
jgi:hypothetical protein